MRLSPLHRAFLSTYDNGAHAALAEQETVDPSTLSDPLLTFVLSAFPADMDAGNATEDRITSALSQLLGLLETVIQLRRSMVDSL